MKKILVILFLLSSITTFSQNNSKALFIDNKNINELKVNYIEIVAWNNHSTKTWRISIDYGLPYAPSMKMKFKDENGKELIFKSPMHAVNYLEECGWELKFTKGCPSGSFELFIYTMKRKK